MSTLLSLRQWDEFQPITVIKWKVNIVGHMTLQSFRIQNKQCAVMVHLEPLGFPAFQLEASIDFFAEAIRFEKWVFYQLFARQEHM